MKPEIGELGNRKEKLELVNIDENKSFAGG